MRADVLLVFTALFGSSAAFRRSCRKSGEGEGWYYTTNSDTLEAVAADFCTKPSVIQQWNHLTALKPGVNIKVPCRYNAGKQRDCRKNTATDGAYVIVSGDMLKDIAYDFCTNSDVLQRMNSAKIPNKDVIFPNTVIQVPCSWN
ncbi:hypothetical protein C8034_v000351 [Colletotrichum sidae]|uniref:LysM domain-containing protein n=1 Tax=Colletotrichum sidae TaxID=1347389 RepID=A0A4R8TFP8_9PEZI|nr:hypothetical protein C8034_v000351 [Colletotrichum sidae]